MSVLQKVVCYAARPIRREEIHEHQPITRRRVRDNQRAGFFPRYAGQYFL